MLALNPGGGTFLSVQETQHGLLFLSHHINIEYFCRVL